VEDFPADSPRATQTMKRLSGIHVVLQAVATIIPAFASTAFAGDAETGSVK
jgi:hypothetical protein